jgi:hypothetical protein
MRLMKALGMQRSALGHRHPSPELRFAPPFYCKCGFAVFISGSALP